MYNFMVDASNFILMQYILLMDIKIDWLQNGGFVFLTVGMAFIRKQDIAL